MIVVLQGTAADLIEIKSSLSYYYLLLHVISFQWPCNGPLSTALSFSLKAPTPSLLLLHPPLLLMYYLFPLALSLAISVVALVVPVPRATPADWNTTALEVLHQSMYTHNLITSASPTAHIMIAI